MKVALGFKSHSGWAAMVVVGAKGDSFEVIDRRRIELIEEGQVWAKQPYHAAEDLENDEVRLVVEKGTESARRVALRRMREAVSRIAKARHQIAACAVLIPGPMPDWSTDEILAVHFRMHKAEGVLFPDALCRAAKECKLTLAAIPEKHLEDEAKKALAMSPIVFMRIIADLRKAIGPPWGKDQKSAALAAIIALKLHAVR